MLGYISSTRKKSCRACVKSKRRCDLGFPSCRRCLSKRLDCTYPNATVREAEVVVRQRTPDLVPLDVETASSNVPLLPQGPSSIDPVLLQSSSENLSTPATSAEDSRARHNISLSPHALEQLLPQVWEPIMMSQRQVNFIINKMCTFVPSIAISGNTPFMHETLYQDWQPQAFQDSCGISALYLVKTTKNLPIITKSIDSKIAAMIATSKTWNLAEHLAAVQALLIYQIIRLFDPDLGLQPLAHRQNTLLEIWTATLWKRSFNELDPTTTCYRSWVFQESLRRTVLMSVFLRGIWSSYTNNGLCDQVRVLAKLPITQDTALWSSDVPQWNANSPCSAKGGYLTSYSDMAAAWTPQSPVGGLDEFERVLLAACQGGFDSRLLEE